MQMHFLLASCYFSESSLPKVNVFVSNGVDAGSVTWQKLQPVSGPCQQQVVILPLWPQQGHVTLLSNQPRRKNFPSFNVWNLDPPASPNAQQNCSWLFARVILSKLQSKDFLLPYSAIILAPTLLFLHLQGDNELQRPERALSTSQIPKYSK
jgi:hypothetical protein